jgi:PfaD family protein
MIQADNGIHAVDVPGNQRQVWQGASETLAFDEAGIRACLLNLEQPCYVVREAGRIGFTNAGYSVAASSNADQQRELLAVLPSIPPQHLGDVHFLHTHGVRYAYYGGAMANGIASEEMVIALGRDKLLGSFGAAGLVPTRIEAAIQRIQQALPAGPYAFNLIHSPSEEALERGAVDLFLRHGVHTVEASAYLALTPHIVRYRVAGLRLNQQNQIESTNRVIAKLSRREVATQFLQPAPQRILGELVEQGLITHQQANMAQHVPMADDITAEADSGGHTDNRPLVALLPSLLALRDEMQAHYQYPVEVRVGAGGGISTPQSALAAFMMGAAYIVTGSVNQGCIEAGASAHTKKLLAQAGMADVMMAPAADMFEMGVKLQVLKKGTLFPMRAQKLYDIYQAYDSLEAIPQIERDKLERQVFKKGLDDIWRETVAYFSERDPEQISRAEQKPKRKMALVFRWYLGLSSRWSNTGESGREMDYQIWCGPAMGAFNDWVRGSYLETPENRSVGDVAHHIMRGTALFYRVQSLKMQGVYVPAYYGSYQPERLTGQYVSV